MSFTRTYTGNPATIERDAVRWLIGDTDNTSWKTTDEEIAFALGEEPNVYFAAAMCAKSIGSKFATLVDKSVGDLKISYGQRQSQYRDLARDLELRGTARVGSILATGISRAEVRTEEQDTDRLPPAFSIGQDDNPGAGQPGDNDFWSSL